MLISIAVAVTAAQSQIPAVAVSNSVDTLDFLDGDGNVLYSLVSYAGEFYKGELFGAGVSYNFKNNMLSGLDKYMFLSASPADPSLLDWSSGIVAPAESLLLSSVDLANQKFVLVRYLVAGDSDVYELFQLDGVQFDVSVNQCLDDQVSLTAASSLKGMPVDFNAGVLLTVMGTTCQYTLSPGDPSVVIPKDLCGISYDVEFNFVLASGPIVTAENSQMYNLVCFQNLSNVTVETGNITDVDAPVTAIQNITDFAIPSMSFVSVDDGSLITEAFLGDMVRLLIEIPSEYRTNFDIKLTDCLLDGEPVLQDGSPLTGFLSDPVKQSQGVIVIDFPLFRKLVGNQLERLVVMQCTIETCINACANSKRRRRRFATIPFLRFGGGRRVKSGRKGVAGIVEKKRVYSLTKY